MKRAVIYSVFLAATLIGCSSPSQPTDIEESATLVSSIQAKPECVSKTLRVFGEIEAADSVAIYSKVSGKLIEYGVKKGCEIKKGELIADVDRDEIGYKYNHAPIYSPISGIVSSIPLHQGSEVRPDIPVGYVMNINTVKAVFSLPERYRNKVQVGQQVDVFIDTLQNSCYHAEISEINPLIDPLSHAFSLEVKIDNPNKELIPGMFAYGDIILETFSETIMLPEEAIIPYQGGWYVYKINGDQAVFEKVKLGLRQQGRVQILDGVIPDDLIVVGGGHKILDGQKVRSKQL